MEEAECLNIVVATAHDEVNTRMINVAVEKKEREKRAITMKKDKRYLIDSNSPAIYVF